MPNLAISGAAEGGSVEAEAEADGPDLQVWRGANGEVTAYCYELDGYCWIRWVGVAGYCFDRQANTVTAFPEPNLDSFFIQDH